MAPSVIAPSTDNAQSKTMTPVQQIAQAPLQEPHVWNTKNLGLRLASDLASGLTAAGLVAPLISVIDK